MSRKEENIYKRKDGRWEGRYKKGIGTDGRIVYGSCYGRTYREVKEKMDKCKLRVLTGDINKKKNVLKVLWSILRRMACGKQKHGQEIDFS